MVTEKLHSIESPDYYGITLLDIGSYAAHLLVDRTASDTSGLFFKEATAHYDSTRRALTVEGSARTDVQDDSLHSPKGALNHFSASAKIAREMEELAKPLAS